MLVERYSSYDLRYLLGKLDVHTQIFGISSAQMWNSFLLKVAQQTHLLGDFLAPGIFPVFKVSVTPSILG